ncbi:MAG: ATP-binding protein, partial [Byssovorax sp.]
IARTLESSEDAESRVRHGLELLRGIVPYDCCALLETRAGLERRLVVVPELVADQRVSMAETLDQMLALLSESHEHPAPSDERSGDAPLKSWKHHLAVPLIGLDHVIGVLFVGSAEEPYEAEDLSLFSIVAAQLAAYLMTVRLQQEKDEFIATLSHELRTPLTAVLGWASLLRSGSLGEAAHLRGVEAVARNAGTLTRLTDDLLDLSRIATGKLRVELRPLAVQQVVGAAIDAARPLANNRSILLDYEVDQVEGMVLGDTERLQQVVSNLLANALKFTPSGGKVTIRVEETARHVSIEVRDTGKGISEDFLPYVFDRSRQATLSSRRGYDGLGLGLGIVRSLVQLHGGQVRAESGGPGAGATFTVVLPLATGSDSPLPASSRTTTTDAPHTTVRLQGARVLVVDDDADVREVIQAILELHGAEVTSAASATEALAAIERSIPNVLLCDISMPDEDGPSLLRKVTKRWPRIPAAALTARTTAADRHQALEAGFNIHVAKPVEPEVLVATVGRLWNAASESARP